MRKIAAVVMMTLSTACALADDTAKPVDDAKLDAAIQKWVETHPEVLVQVVSKYVAETRAKAEDNKHDVVVNADADLMQTEGIPILGKADAPVTVVYFVDAACHYCRHESTAIVDMVSRNPDVRVVQRWVRFLTPASEYAARVAGVVYARHQVKYMEFYAILMANNGPLTKEMVDAAVASAIGDDAVAPVSEEASDSVSKAWSKTVDDNMQLAGRIGINGTPFHYVHGAGRAGVLEGELPPAKIMAAVAIARAAVKPVEVQVTPATKADAPKSTSAKP